LLPAVLALAVAGCGDSASMTGSEEPATQAACRDGRKALVASLESSLNAQGGGPLEHVQTVEVQDPKTAPVAGLKMYVAAGSLGAPGVDGEKVAWAVSRSMLETGGGRAYPLDSVTREFSDLGSAAAANSVVRAYADAVAESDAYEQARSCVEE
jgi:hypothetical protein